VTHAELAHVAQRDRLDRLIEAGLDQHPDRDRARARLLVAIISIASVSKFGADHSDARHRVLDTARLIAQKIDAQLGATETLLNRLSVELSTNPDDVAANDALLQRELPELPKSASNILLLLPDERNIGNAVGNHASAGDR
jgi:hypothetical protein